LKVFPRHDNHFFCFYILVTSIRTLYTRVEHGSSIKEEREAQCRNTHDLPLTLVSIVASNDVALLEIWERHLRPLEQAGLITFWSQRQVAPGIDYEQDLQEQLASANMVALLLSADFLMIQTAWRSWSRCWSVPELVRSA
jgi:hypothetical protein